MRWMLFNSLVVSVAPPVGRKGGRTVRTVSRLFLENTGSWLIYPPRSHDQFAISKQTQ